MIDGLSPTMAEDDKRDKVPLVSWNQSCQQLRDLMPQNDKSLLVTLKTLKVTMHCTQFCTQQSTHLMMNQ